MREEPERPTHMREEPERPTHMREEPERPKHMRGKYEHPTHMREEPERPMHMREEPEHPTHMRGEHNRPTHMTGKHDRPTNMREEPERPAPTREEPERPTHMRGKHDHPTHMRGKYDRPTASEEIWDWLMDPKGNIEEALSMEVDLLWARDGEQWEAWEQQHHPASLSDIAAVVINYLAAEIGMPPQVRFPSGGATLTPPPQAVGMSTPGLRGEPHQPPVTRESSVINLKLPTQLKKY
ncbi:hypothetical protein EOD39_15057 [Acipenser ruthenus]|uniref:Uncharacterized protein n=1 Tax=Acipenser ruthenus TaxID=7906 RepID=A0A662YLT5_ACIRT|nr:hypothetical protein EOD39_15057 [Acipenser ruthenus]